MTQTHTKGPLLLCTHLQSVEKDRACGCGFRGVIGSGDFAICEMGSTQIAGEEGLELPRVPRQEEIANAHLIAAAYNSYDKHCGPNAIACAEGDLLGEALAALSECVDFHGDDESPELDWPHLRRARAVLLKAKGEA